MTCGGAKRPLTPCLQRLSDRDTEPRPRTTGRVAGRSIAGFNGPTAAVCCCTVATPASATCSSRDRSVACLNVYPSARLAEEGSHPVRQGVKGRSRAWPSSLQLGFGTIKKRCRRSGARRLPRVLEVVVACGAASLYLGYHARQTDPKVEQAEVSTTCRRTAQQHSSSKPSWSLRTAETIRWTAELLAPSTWSMSIAAHRSSMGVRSRSARRSTARTDASRVTGGSRPQGTPRCALRSAVLCVAPTRANWLPQAT